MLCKGAQPGDAVLVRKVRAQEYTFGVWGFQRQFVLCWSLGSLLLGIMTGL